ncbi:MAG TPA: hypothetical protein VMC79_01785 [Rectinemataceae bacterium]|nr:hypothetical protein [Rectinemataceae bacterium]
MKFKGALIKEQGVTFMIVVVKLSVLASPTQRDKDIATLKPLFPGIPIVLMAQESAGTAKYYGRPDIVKFLAHIKLSQIPWKEYTVTRK